MSGHAEPGRIEWDDEIDDADVAILNCMRELYEAADPVPAQLYTRVHFALDLDNVERELARICADLELATAVRGVEQARTITFECESLTIAVTITPTTPDRNRVDGWIAPPSALAVEMRSGRHVQHTSSDDDGRFVFHDVASGEMQLTIRPQPSSSRRPERTIVTQPIVL
jgi:hypothetical protein